MAGLTYGKTSSSGRRSSTWRFKSGGVGTGWSWRIKGAAAAGAAATVRAGASRRRDRKSTRLNSNHGYISYAGFCLEKKKKITEPRGRRVDLTPRRGIRAVV